MSRLDATVHHKPDLGYRAEPDFVITLDQYVQIGILHPSKSFLDVEYSRTSTACA
jgi:hypothetical protein